MTKVSKLEEDGHLQEAKSLRDEGRGYIEIADTLNLKYYNGDRHYSHMAIKRGLESLEKKSLDKAIDEGRDPIDEMTKEFREAIRKNNRKLNKLLKTADEILQDALAEGTITEKAKALKEVRDSLAQVVKNWIALQQYGIRQATNIGDISRRREQDIKILIINWTEQLMEKKRQLCAKCKKEIDDLLEDLVKK